MFTLSIHGANNFPFRKTESDLDVPLADGTDGTVYLKSLSDALARATTAARPGLAVFLAGADPYVGDRFGKLGLTASDLRERDRRVLELCGAAGIPVAIVMSGGYASRISDIVDIHYATVRLAAEFSERAR